MSGSAKGVFWKSLEKESFQKSLLEILEFLENPRERLWKTKEIRPFSTDSREFRDFRDSRDFSSEKTPFVMTPFSRSREWKITHVFGNDS